MTDEMIQKIASHAAHLSTLTVKELRLAHPDNTDGTHSGSQWKGISSARLIEDIMFEFVTELIDEEN